MQHLNLNHLFYFYTIASEGSIRNACQKLSLTQSTLSNQLKELEYFIGENLFERVSKKLRLNETGKKVLTYATEIFRLRDELTLCVKQRCMQRVQVVRIGFVPCFMRSDIYLIFRYLLDQNQAFIMSKQDCLSNLLNELASKAIDAILSDRPILHESYNLKNRELGKKQLAFVGHKKFAHLATAFPHSLNGVPFCVHTEGSQIQQVVDKYFKANRVSPKIVGEFDDVGPLKLFAEDGQGIVAIPLEFVKDSIASGQLLQIGIHLDLQVKSWLISLQHDKLDDDFRKCIDHIKEQQMIAV
ncbi:MAG: LysR family transcriptional regulator [Bdellovibrio sp.]|nr:LysR family transcriptional regulator [Bdellovibrio sp.]